MPKPTQAEVAALVANLRRAVPAIEAMSARNIVREAADALEALAVEGAEPTVRQMPQPWNCPATAEICDRGCGAACEKLGMVTRNPTPDASVPMVPSESRTFTIGAAPPAKPAGELPPLPEPVAHMWQHGETGNTGFVTNAPTEELEQWERMNRPRKLVCPMFAAEQMRAYALRALRERA